MSQSVPNAGKANGQIRKISKSEPQDPEPTPPREQRRKRRHSSSEESSSLAKRPDQSRSSATEFTQLTASSAPPVPANTAFEDVSMQDSSLNLGQSNPSWDHASTLDHNTEDTSLAEDHHPQTEPPEPGSEISYDHLLFNMDVDLAQVGTLVTDEGRLAEALRVAPDEVLDDVTAELEGILREAATILSKLQSALDSTEQGL